jgi:hypothetical protein
MKIKIEGDNNIYTAGLQELSWRYIKSMIVEEFKDNRATLLNALRLGEQAYIKNTWVPKEKRVIWAYTKFYSNLESTSS